MIYTLFIYQKFAWLLVILCYTIVCAPPLTKTNHQNYEDERGSFFLVACITMMPKMLHFWQYLFLLVHNKNPDDDEGFCNFLLFYTSFALVRVRWLMLITLTPKSKNMDRHSFDAHTCCYNSDMSWIKWWNMVGLILVPFFVCFVEIFDTEVWIKQGWRLSIIEF